MAHILPRQTDMDPVNPLDFMTSDKRSVAIYRAAQVLADAERCWKGQTPRPLLELEQDERMRYWQEARNVIDQFLLIMSEQEPVTRGDLRVIDGGKERL